MAKTEKRTKKEETEDKYNLHESLKTLETSEHLKKGFEYYVNVKNINITNDTNLGKEFKKFLNKNVGA